MDQSYIVVSRRLLITAQLSIIFLILLTVPSRTEIIAHQANTALEKSKIEGERLVNEVEELVYDVFVSNKVFLEGINDVLVSQHELDFLVNPETSACTAGEVLGAHSEGMIIIKDSGTELNKRTLHHEIGHNVWSKLSIKERKEWNLLFDLTTNFITPYSRLNPNENFAENFACYFTDYNNCYEKITPEKLDFLVRSIDQT